MHPYQFQNILISHQQYPSEDPSKWCRSPPACHKLKKIEGAFLLRHYFFSGLRTVSKILAAFNSPYLNPKVLLNLPHTLVFRFGISMGRSSPFRRLAILRKACPAVESFWSTKGVPVLEEMRTFSSMGTSPARSMDNISSTSS